MDRNVGVGSLYTGKTITAEGSLSCLAVYACVRLLSETIATLPLLVYKHLETGGKERDRTHPLYPILHDQPNPEMTSVSLRETEVGHICLWGNAYQEIQYDDRGINVVALWPLRPDRMAVKRNESGRLYYEYTLPSGERKTFGKMQIHHVHGFSSNGLIGYSPITLAREAIGMSLAAEEYGARFFGNDSTPGGILTHPGKLKPEAKLNLKESWEEAHKPLSNKHRVAVLEEGITWTAVGIPPKDAQFIDMRKFQKSEIAMLFNVKPHMIGDLDRATFSNVEQMAIENVVYTLRPWLVRLEQAKNSDLFTPRDRETHFAEFLVDGLLRGDIAARYAAYAVGRNNGWLNPDEIRELENMNPIPDGQGKVYLVPMNMIPASQLSGSPSPKPAPALPPPEKKSIEVEEVRARWSGSAASRRRLAKSYERLFSDATLRLVKREEAEIMRAAGKYLERRDNQEMQLYLDDFYRDFPPVIVKAMQPILASLADVVSADALAEIGFDDDVDPEMDLFVREYSDILARDYVDSSQGQLKNVLAVAIAAALNPVEALQARFDEWKEKRPEKVAEKESREATNSVTRRKWIRKGVTKLRWVTAGDSCPFCAGLNGKIVGIEQVFISAGEEFKPEGAETAFKPSRKVSYPPIHKGCLPGDAHIATVGGVAAQTQRWYDGDLIVIHTARGYKLACTPNHPILTPSGWLAAHFLDIGSRVISRSFGNPDMGMLRNNENVVARIEDIAETFVNHPSVVAIPMPVSAEDFHGDGIGSQVAIVRPNGLLSDRLYAPTAQHFSELHFEWRDETLIPHPPLGHSATLLKGTTPATRSFVSGSRLPLTFLGSHPAHVHLGGGLYAANSDVALDEMPADDISTYVESLCHRQFGLAGEVSADYVIDIKINTFSGHVYNLQTEHGFYIAENIITHNCACGISAA